MFPQYEDEEDDLLQSGQEPADEPPADGPDDEEDFLEGLDDNARQKAEAYADRVAKQRATDTANKLRGAFGRFGQAQNILGITVDEHGNPAVVDPERLANFASRYAGAPAQQASQQQPQEEPLGPAPDPSLEPEEFAAWMDRRDAMRDAKLEQRFAALSQRTAAQQVPNAMEAARAYLDEEFGLGAIADTPEFRAQLQNAITSGQVDPTNELGFQAAVGALIPIVRREIKARGGEAPRRQQQQPSTPDPQQRRAQQAAANRASLQQTAPSRNNGRRAEVEYSAQEREIAELTGMSLAEARALTAPVDLRTGHSDYYDYRQRQKQPVGGRR